jgi:phospholipid/cholesterol/gamma-HCH transport system substrate-binding protein
MKKFRERNLLIIAAIAGAIFLIGAAFTLNIQRLTGTTYSAYVQSAVGLQSGDVVTIAGVRVGSVTGLSLAGQVAKVTFSVSGSRRLGEDTEMHVKVLNPVGVEYLELVPKGPGRLRGTIPVSRTTIPGTLVGDLNQFTSEAQQTNIPQLVHALEVLTQTVAANSPAQAKAALDGVADLSAVLASRQQEIEQLNTQAYQLTSLLNSHSGQLVDLLVQSNVLLQVLDQRKAAIDNLLATTSRLTAQIDHLIVGDRAELDPMLSNLEALSAFLARDSSDIGDALPLVAAFSRYSANLAGSGPYADFVAPTLVVPDNLIDQCAGLLPLDPQRGCRA